MSATFDDLRVLKIAEEIADSIWKRAAHWDKFAREVVGVQLAKAADSIGANIAESFGRFHFGEKLQFLYFARGSLFETKHWLNRAQSRELMPLAEAQQHASQLTDLVRQLNTFANSLKNVRAGEQRSPKTLRELAADYTVDNWQNFPETLFADAELDWLNS
ncbi:MAG: four helix bundle protein [Chloroflexi bacterium]|nr:four helix bundle protein [Chloroflexota bacterium]